MCFALYGSTSAGDREAKDLRSDHAADTAVSEVEFTFTIGDAVYRVFRRPIQDAAKKKGVGLKRIGSQASLSRHVGLDDADPWEVVTTQSTKVTKQIEELLGFREEQFRHSCHAAPRAIPQIAIR